MSRDVLTVGSIMRISLLYLEEYSQWVERFMNYLEEQTDGEAMINSIKNCDKPLPRVTQVSISGTSSTEQPPLKDKSMCNKTAKDLWDALARHMLGSEYDEQDRKAAVLYEYETFKATEGELLLDTYIRYLQVINDLKKCGYSKDNCELNFKFLNNLQPKWKQYATMMRQNKNLVDINIDALYNILKQNQGDVNDAIELKMKTVVVTSDPFALIAEKTNVSKRKEKVVVSSDSKGSDADDFSELKKITALLAKAFNRRKFYSKPTNNNLRTSSTSQSANKKQEFVKTDNKKVKKKDDEKKRDMSRVKCYNCKNEGHFTKDCKKVKVKDYKYYKTKMLLAKKDKDEQVLLAEDQAWMESSSDLDRTYGIGFENPSYFEKAKDLRPTLYDKKVINLGSLKPYVPNVILEKIIIDLEDEVVSLLEKEKSNLETIESLKSKGFESSENAISKSENQSENDCHVVEKECGKVENSKVIAPGMFKLSVSQSVSPISITTTTSCDSKNVENKTKRKRRKRKSSKQNDKQVNNDVSHANSDFVHFSDLDTFSSIRRPSHSGVIWKKKGSSNTSNVDLSSVSHLKLNKDVKRYSRKDLLSCNNYHLGETSSAYVCNDAMNVSCNSRMCDLFDENNLFIFDDESVRISPVSKMPFRKKPRDSMNVRSKSNSNKSLPRTVHRWLPKMQLSAEPVAKWFPRIVQICLWIIDSGCSKHMTGNRALLTNFMEKFLGTVYFRNNDFAVIAGYGDVVIGSMTIKKVYYVEGLGHNLFSVG
nr:integrase, catalytic region, zinc finger, CCHC-type, peptidase aspartic, catalytic [Tanacetum cinerariifolium]